jgi:peroxiredoxin
VNELYQAIEARKDLKNKMKVIGIGTGNSDFEVNFFRKKYDVPFPLFSDEDYVIHKTMGEVRTPYFIGVRLNGDGKAEVFYSKLGGFSNSKKFLDLMVKSSGL